MTALLVLILAGVRLTRRPTLRGGRTTYWYHGQPISRAEYLALGGDS